MTVSFIVSVTPSTSTIEKETWASVKDLRPREQTRRERQWEGNPRAMAGTHEVERSLLWLKSKSISAAYKVMGFPEPGKEDRAFLSREHLLPQQLLQKASCKTLVIWCADPTKVQPLRISSEKVLDLKNECSQPHSTEQVSIIFFLSFELEMNITRL